MQADTTFDHPLDLGIIIGSTCDAVWEAEMTRSAGLRVLSVLCTCQAPRTCNVPAREHVQTFISYHYLEDFLSEFLDHLAPHEGKSEEEVVRVANMFIPRTLPEGDEHTAATVKIFEEIKQQFEENGWTA